MSKRSSMKKKERDPFSRWTVADSLDLYGIERWSQGLFTANDKGHLCLRTGKDCPDVDLKALVDEIHLRGLQLPVVLRFTDILQKRIEKIVGAFDHAIKEEGYGGNYLPVYPIKVNQHRHVVSDLTRLGREHHLGLEAGSKPELLLAIAMQSDPQALIICNGFKDREYVELALSGSKLGSRIFLVVEKLSELPLILQVAKEMKVEPLLGMRMKLASRGRGPWESSGGDRSKFGLTASEILEAVKLLRRSRMLDRLRLLHFHIGSQITDIQAIKVALREATQMFAEIRRLGAPIDHLDVGGGLAVDYDGSHTNFASSANYDPREYAADVISATKAACEELDLPHPTIVTETGRALVAHHSVLVVEALAAYENGSRQAPALPRKASEIVVRMHEILEGFIGKNFQETYHDLLETRRESLILFNFRHITLEERALVEQYFWAGCRRILEYVQELDYIPDELSGMERLLSTTYFCNFSLFQSLPDHWAVKQLFPVAPLHRLDERPDRHGILADITCDSDGVIDRFVDLRDVRDTLPLHSLREGERYCLGVFLVGAYQEILGDLHNLFGDTHVLHVSSGPDGYVIDKAVEGERVEDVLDYVATKRGDMLAALRAQVEAALRRGDIKLEESAPVVRRLEQGLEGYTYLQSPNPQSGKKPKKKSRKKDRSDGEGEAES